MDPIFDRDYDYIDSDDSGSDNAESSEDEIDILLQGTAERKVKLSRRRASWGDVQGDAEESSEDDFEKEMNKELDDQVASIEARRKSLTGASTSVGNAEHKEENSGEKKTVYDEVYFDSDEEEMVEGGKRNKKQNEVPSNEELLYDPDMDDDDQRWMDSRRQRYQPSPRQGSGPLKPGQVTNSSKKKRLPNSDAVLDCPACMTTLCLDCQRHAVYTNQYRAMFVAHCTVDLQEVLKYPKETQTHKNSKRKKKSKFTETVTATQTVPTDNTEDSKEYDVYHPVRCSECNTLVAMYDKEEIYHFFNVLSSYS